MRGGSRDLLLWSGSGSCSRKPTTMTLRNGQLDRSNAGFRPKPPHPGHDGRFSGLKPGYASSRLTHGLNRTPSARRLQIRRAAMVSNSASLKPLAADDATVWWAKRRQRRRVPTVHPRQSACLVLPNGLSRNPVPPHPNRCASQNAAPAARPPTSAVCSADLILLTPVKWPLMAPKIKSAMPVAITEMRSADEMSAASM